MVPLVCAAGSGRIGIGAHVGTLEATLRDRLPWVGRKAMKRVQAAELAARQEALRQSAEIATRDKELATRAKEIRAQAKQLERQTERIASLEAQLTARDAEWRGRDYFARGAAHAIDGIPDARCFVLQNLLRGLGSLEGDIAECGVRFGKSSVFLLEAGGTPRAMHLFDSFEGVSAPTAEDNLAVSGKPFWQKHQLSVDEETVRANLAGFDNVALYRGWIPERFPEVEDRLFAFVHVDVDLYDPTLATLQFFWPRLVQGGIVVCDDYGSPRCPGAKRALDEFFSSAGIPIVELPTMQAFAVKR